MLFDPSWFLTFWKSLRKVPKLQVCKYYQLQNVNTHKWKLRNCLNLLIISSLLLHSNSHLPKNKPFTECTTIFKIIKIIFWPYVFCAGISVLHITTDIKVKYFYFCWKINLLHSALNHILNFTKIPWTFGHNLHTFCTANSKSKCFTPDI